MREGLLQEDKILELGKGKASEKTKMLNENRTKALQKKLRKKLLEDTLERQQEFMAEKLLKKATLNIEEEANIFEILENDKKMNMFNEEEKYRKTANEGGLLQDDEKRMGYAEGGYLQEEFIKSKDAFVKKMAETQMKDVENEKDKNEFIRLSKEDRNKVGNRLGIEEDLDSDIKEAVREMAEDNNPLLSTRQIRKEGGSLLADDMETPMMPEEMPEMDTDSDMEENYTRFIMDEALSEEEEDMLVSKLEQDEELQMLFDKVIDVAQEFAGNGPVEGPGTGVSDDIPARLSDGEFVFTAKAVEEIGEDTLMSMMKDAEVAADERQGLFLGGTPDEEEIEDEESNVSNDMRKVNPRLNPNVR